MLLVLAAAGCGGGNHAGTTTGAAGTATPSAAADCLNSDGFVVSVDGEQLSGSSPGGVNFTVTFYKSRAVAAAARTRLDPAYSAAIAADVVDDFGNPPLHPGGAPAKLGSGGLETLRHCIELGRPG